MYNQFIATRKKGRRPATESNTAGAAKTVSISARSKSELKEWGERMNLTPGPRTQSEIRGMSSQQVLWEEAWNGEEYNKALALPDKIKAHKDIDSQWKAKKFWDADSTEGATPDEYKALTADFKKFIDTYPQYKTPHADENNQRLFDWLRDRHMAPIFSNLVLAFEATAMEGRLWLSPSAIAAGKESEVFGTDHHAFHLLVQPQRRNADADDGLSADEYLEANKDVFADKRVPPIIAAREAKANATAAHFAQAETVSASSGSTKVVNYPQEQHAVPPQPDKASFRKKINSMTADQIQQECSINPTFKKALDQME